MSDQRTVLTLSGNPRAGSRTSVVASTVASAVTTAWPGASVTGIELADLADQVLGTDRSEVDAARAAVAAASVLVVATPVYKASYTGLLKAFLDGYGPDALRGVVAVPVVVSATPAHSFAGEVHLRPLLVELGATVPARALALTEAELADLPAAIARWADTAVPVIIAAADTWRRAGA